MNFLFISIYYYPEIGSSDYYISDLISYLIKNNNAVSIAAPNPVRDLDKETIDKYSNIQFERFNSCDVYRFYCGKNNSNKVTNRVIRIIKFKQSLRKFLIKNHKRFDAVYFPSNPPIFVPLMIEKLGKKYGFKTIYSVNDLWPQILGKYKFLQPFSKKAILYADKLITLSNEMKNTIFEFTKREDIDVIRIWPDDSVFDDRLDNKNFNYSIFNQDVFNVFYIGNIGAFQNIDFILDVAKLLSSKNKIHFYIVGSGRLKSHIEERIRIEKIQNVSCLPRVNNKVASSLYKLSSLNIISLDRNVIKYACPSKTSTCIFSKKPCLLLMDQSTYSDELSKFDYFYINSSFDPQNVAITITELSNKAVGESEVDLNQGIANEYSKEINLSKYLKIFQGNVDE